MIAMAKAPTMVIMALVLSLLALPAFGVRGEGALTFSNFKRRMHAHGHRNTKLATITTFRPRVFFKQIQL